MSKESENLFNKFVSAAPKKQFSVPPITPKNHEINGKIFKNTNKGKNILKGTVAADNIVAHRDDIEIGKLWLMAAPPERQTRSNKAMDTFDCVAVKMAHVQAEIQPQFRNIEKTQQAASKDFNQHHKCAQMEAAFCDSEGLIRSAPDFLTKKKEAVLESQKAVPKSVVIEQSIECSEDSKDCPEFNQQQQENANFLKEKVESYESVQVPNEDIKQLPSKKNLPEASGIEENESADFNKGLNDGLTEKVNQVKEQATAETIALVEGAVGRDSEPTKKSKQKQKPQPIGDCAEVKVSRDSDKSKPSNNLKQEEHQLQISDCEEGAAGRGFEQSKISKKLNQKEKPQSIGDREEGEVPSDDDSLCKPDKGNDAKGNNCYQMFEKRQLTKTVPRGASVSGNYFLGLVPPALIPAIHYEKSAAEPFFPQHRPLMRIGTLLRTPLFIKALPFVMEEVKQRQELVTHRTTNTVGTSITWKSNSNSFSPTKERDLSRRNSHKETHSGGSSPVNRMKTHSQPVPGNKTQSPAVTAKMTHSPPATLQKPDSLPVTLKRSGTRSGLSPSVSPPRYTRHLGSLKAVTKRRRSRSSSRDCRAENQRATRPSPRPAHSTRRISDRRLRYLIGSPHSSNRRSAARRSPSPPKRRRSPSRSSMRLRSPSSSMRRSIAKSSSRVDRSRPIQPRCPSPPIRHRTYNAPKQFSAIRRSKPQMNGIVERRLRSVSPMLPRKRKLSASSSSSNDTTLKGSPPEVRPTQKMPRKLVLQLKLARLNKQIGEPKRLRLLKMKLAAKMKAKY
ncbi:serine/arginine repetitive matrix protein 1-like [Drosophila subobscura]|uniref:serine/arginine repetitive matrix protein 1-like n=1 Tax=Drosophila subobscura TaxID=7241 RepID=UPI00155A82E5|nr:serine/arginine repetitive matrix protein 1-like [Drosophila subobscura]